MDGDGSYDIVSFNQDLQYGKGNQRASSGWKSETELGALGKHSKYFSQLQLIQKENVLYQVLVNC